MEQSGADESELCREDCKLGAEAYNNVLEAAMQSTGDPLFGLHAGENLNLQAAGLIVQIAHSSKTVHEALQYCCEFANLGCSALPLGLSEEQEHYRLTMTPNPVWLHQSPLSVEQTIYGYLAFTIKEFHSLTHQKHYPKEIWLTCHPPQDTGEVLRVVGCPVRYNMSENAVFFYKRHVEQPVVTSDYSLLQVLVAHAHEKTAAAQGANSFYHVVRKSVVNLVKPEFPTIEQIAGHLNMSVRTFQRKLKAEGYSYKVIIDELRKEFALGYLKNPELNIGDIAYLLGYADNSAFVRSFKRWTGQTPAGYRSTL